MSKALAALKEKQLFRGGTKMLRRQVEKSCRAASTVWTHLTS